jgi:aldose 1-epimerase
MRVLTFGGIIAALRVPDRNGVADDIVLGHDDLDGYVTDSPYFGALIGRCANRIANGRFSLDGVTYQLPRNNGGQHLHGGTCGFDKALWRATSFTSATGAGVVLAHTSIDGDQGYPGTLDARVEYMLAMDGTLSIEYAATTDRATVVNLTQHSYFNLSGARAGDILSHELTIHADCFTPVDERLIPTGAIESVEATPFDFRTVTPIGARVDTWHEQLRYAGGYDHNFVLNHSASGELAPALRVTEPLSGRTLEVLTTQPGLQFYSGNFLDGAITGKGGRRYDHRAGFCIETQHFPNSPNHPGFPSVVLRPGERHHSRTVFAFGTDG